MSYIPGTENRMIPSMAPKAAHGRNYKKMHQKRANTERDMKLINMFQETPEYLKRTHANIAIRENFLNQQQSGNALNEQERLKGILSTYRDPSLRDGVAMQNRINYLEKRMMQLKPKPLAGAEGLYMF